MVSPEGPVKWGPRALLRGGLILLWLCILFVPHMMFRTIGVPSPVPQYFLIGAARIVGLAIKIFGVPLKHHVLFVSNHVSWMDILALGSVSRASFVSKVEVEEWPLIGWLADQAGTVYVKRDDRSAVMRQAQDLRSAVAQGCPVILFPEGTTNDWKEIKPFRASLLASMVDPPAQARVQPVALDYGKLAAAIAWTEDELGPNVKRILAHRGRIPLHIHFLDPVAEECTHDRKVLAGAARQAIVSTLDPGGKTASDIPHDRL